MFVWPNLELTEYERKFVRIYKTKDRPGVLRRTYKVVLNDPAQVNSNLPIVQTTGQIQIARRSRVFGMSFSGNTDSWRLNISNASGTLYTVKTPRTGLDPIVSSMTPGTLNNAAALGGLAPPLTAAPSDGIGPNLENSQVLTNNKQPCPFIIEPNWLLLPNETLIFNGTPLHVNYRPVSTTFTPNLVLNIVIHVWEFPVMGTAPAGQREVL